MKQKTVYEMDHAELDDLVRQHLGKKNWDSVVAFEWHNDSAYTATAEKSGYDKEDMERFTSSPRTYPEQCYIGPYQLLSYFADRGLLPEGEYVIKVSW